MTILIVPGALAPYIEMTQPYTSFWFYDYAGYVSLTDISLARTYNLRRITVVGS